MSELLAVDAYTRPTIVRMGAAETLTKQYFTGDICDGTPCTGNWRAFKKDEGGKGEAPPAADHEHDDSKPLIKPA